MKKNLLADLWARTSRCYWCDCPTILTAAIPLPPNAATRDHIISRNNPRSRGHRAFPVLACHECNSQRNIDEQAITHVGQPKSTRDTILRLIAQSVSEHLSAPPASHRHFGSEASRSVGRKYVSARPDGNDVGMRVRLKWKTPVPSPCNNDELSECEVRELQAALGITLPMEDPP